MRRLKSGFTLIELLVVISIIALLVSIMLPALGQARVAARMVQCKSQQRQIGIAMHTYAVDNKGYFPYSAGQEIWYEPYTLEAALVLDNTYLPSNGFGSYYSVAMECPSDPNDYLAFNVPAYSYMYRQRGEFAPLHLDDSVPFQRFLLAEQYRAHAFAPVPLVQTPFIGTFLWTSSPYPGHDSYILQSNWHDGGSNVLYGDGHVVWRNYGETLGIGH